MAALVRILTNRNNAQRQAVAQSFQDKTKQVQRQEVEREGSQKFRGRK